MTIESAVNFLACSILISIGTTILIMGAIAVNRLLAKFWVPVKMFVYHDSTVPGLKFVEEPHLEQHNEPSRNNSRIS